MTALAYSNLIEGSQVIMPVTSSGGNYTISNSLSNVDYQVYPDIATISAGNQGLLTLSNLNGNVYMNILPFQDLPAGSGGGGGYVSGDLTVTGGLTITDLDVDASITGNVITLNGGNRTFGVSPLLEVSSNVEHLVYTNLIHGAEIKVLMNAFTEFTLGDMSNVNRYTYSNMTTVTAGDIALMTFSNLHGSIYADLKISYGTIGIVATGGTITTADGYKIHTFTSSGDFTVTSGGSVEYLIVAGGGAGGYSYAGGGGGGGTLSSTFSVTSTIYSVVVGGGGTSGYANGVGSVGGNGENSSVFGVTSIGGGGGGHYVGVAGASGGCGGGGGANEEITTAPVGGTGSQGGNGGTGSGGLNPYAGGGGGGAGGNGGPVLTSPSNIGGAGGPGATFFGTVYGGGGGGGIGGGQDISTYTKGPGGTGGGGDGSIKGTSAVAGSINTGGGGGGGGGVGQGLSNGGPPGAGGSGIVIIRYPI
jgi:hypothetical protein